jgi:hypothetical protein
MTESLEAAGSVRAAPVGSAKPGAIAFCLDARISLASARVLLPLFEDRALEMAEHGLLDVAQLAMDEPDAEMPWPLRGDCAMETAFEEGARIGRRLRALQARVQTRRAHALATAAQERGERAAAFERTVPTADELLASLKSGLEVEVNGHSLTWDDDFEGLAGVNAYAMDYFWSHDMDPESVAAWRRDMLAGQMLGRCPPGEDDDYGDLAADDWRRYIEETDGDDLWCFDVDGHLLFALEAWWAANLAYEVFKGKQKHGQGSDLLPPCGAGTHASVGEARGSSAGQ